MLPNIPKDFIKAFIEERGVAHGGWTGDALLINVFIARQEELTRLWSKYCVNYIPNSFLTEQEKIRAYKFFISMEALADND